MGDSRGAGIDMAAAELIREPSRRRKDLPDLLTVAELAHFLKVPKSWVYERTRIRAIPVRKIGRHLRIPRDEFLAWVDKEGSM